MHVLALQMLAHATPGVFKIFGQKMPVSVGEFLHWLAHVALPWAIRSIKLIAMILLVILMLRRGGSIWQLGFCIILGWLILPSLSPKISSASADITKGAAVNHTGASLGLLLVLGAMLAFILIGLPIIRRRSQADAPGGEV